MFASKGMQSHTPDAADRLVEVLGNMRGVRGRAQQISKMSDKVTGSPVWAALFFSGTIGRAKTFQNEVAEFRSGCKKMLSSALAIVTPSDVPDANAVQRYFDLADQFAMRLLEFSETYIQNEFQVTPQSNYAMLEARKESKQILRALEVDYLIAHKANGLPFS